jgi:hypothetical protein
LLKQSLNYHDENDAERLFRQDFQANVNFFNDYGRDNEKKSRKGSNRFLNFEHKKLSTGTILEKMASERINL